jgi:hypothetical protein
MTIVAETMPTLHGVIDADITGAWQNLLRPDPGLWMPEGKTDPANYAALTRR